MRKFLKILILTFLGAVTITSCSDDSDALSFRFGNRLNKTCLDGRGTIIRQKSRTSRMLQKLSHDIFGLMRLLIFLTMPIVRKT